MKRALVYIGILSGPKKEVTAEFMVDAEITKLTKRTPKTKAEREFHAWLTEYKTKITKK